MNPNVGAKKSLKKLEIIFMQQERDYLDQNKMLASKKSLFKNRRSESMTKDALTKVTCDLLK